MRVCEARKGEVRRLYEKGEDKIKLVKRDGWVSEEGREEKNKYN